MLSLRGVNLKLKRECCFSRVWIFEEAQSENFPVFERVSDIVNATLCAKEETNSYHSRECLNRKC